MFILAIAHASDFGTCVVISALGRSGFLFIIGLDSSCAAAFEVPGLDVSRGLEFVSASVLRAGPGFLQLDGLAEETG